MYQPLLTPMLAFFGTLGWPELVVISLLGVLIFGKRLPEVGKSIGKGIVEFKKGLAGIETDLDELPSSPESPQIDTPPPSSQEVDSAQTQETPKQSN